MRRLALIAAFGLAGVAHGLATSGLMAPSLTVTPLIPSTVVAGQVVTASFWVAAEAAPISWAIGVHALTDGLPSGSWDWVVDEDGAYGVTKVTLEPACPNPGVLITAPTPPSLRPMLVPFAVPNYGPAPITMALSVMARQGTTNYCIFDKELYKVFVVNPGPTWTASRTPTATHTPSPVQTATSTPTVGGPPPTSTSVPTTGSTPVPASVPTPGTTGRVRVVVPVPNPEPTRFSFYIEGVADRVVTSIYTYGQTKVYEETTMGPLSGWRYVPAPRPGRGGFIVKVSSFVGGSETAKKYAYVYYY